MNHLLLNREEAIAFIGRGEEFFDEHARPHIPYHQLGKSIYWDRFAILEWIINTRKNPTCPLRSANELRGIYTRCGERNQRHRDCRYFVISVTDCTTARVSREITTEGEREMTNTDALTALIERGGWLPIEQAPKDPYFSCLVKYESRKNYKEGDKTVERTEVRLGEAYYSRTSDQYVLGSDRIGYFGKQGMPKTTVITHFMALDVPERMCKIINDMHGMLQDCRSYAQIAIDEESKEYRDAAMKTIMGAIDMCMEEANRIAGGE